MTSLRDFLRAPRRQALLVTYATRAVAGWLVALPLVGAVSASGVSALPNADRVFFEPGGMFLLELLYREHRGLTAALYSSLWLLCFAWLARAKTTALLFAGTHEPTLSAAAARALRELPRFLGLAGLEIVLKGLLCAGALLAFELTESNSGPTSLLTSATQTVLLLVTATLLISIAVLGDACRAELLRSPRPAFISTLEAASATLARSGLSLVSGWLLWFGTSACLVAVVARVSERLDVGQAGAWRVLLVLGLHQLVIFGLCVAQARWIDRVVALSGVSRPAARTATELS